MLPVDVQRRRGHGGFWSPWGYEKGPRKFEVETCGVCVWRPSVAVEGLELGSPRSVQLDVADPLGEVRQPVGLGPGGLRRSGQRTTQRGRCLLLQRRDMPHDRRGEGSAGLYRQPGAEGRNADPVPAKAARDYLRRKLVGKEALNRRVDTDRFSRTVGDLYLKPFESVGLALVRNGHAVLYRDYAKQCPWAKELVVDGRQIP